MSLVTAVVLKYITQYKKISIKYFPIFWSTQILKTTSYLIKNEGGKKENALVNVFFAKNLPIANKELTPIYCGENGINHDQEILKIYISK